MSLPRYQEYKNSGVEWLGEIPAHWEVVPLKRRYAVVGGSTPKSDESSYWDGEVLWVTPADLSRLDGFEIDQSLRQITEAGLNACGTSLVPAGSIVLSTRAPIGSLGIAAETLCTNQGCKALVPNTSQNSRFAAYALSIATSELNIRGKGTTFVELSGDELGRFPLALPRQQEQEEIVAFLDRETAKIDALIAEQEKLLALLAEKRQATISHAVTRGLNPDAPLKESGIPWLGQVPAHWEVRALKSIASGVGSLFIDGDWIESRNLSDAGIRYITTGNVGVGFYKEQGSGFISEQTFAVLGCTEVKPGDVLISRLNLPIGRACVVPDLGMRVVTSVDNVILRTDAEFDAAYVVYRLSGLDFLHEAANLASGATMQRISRTELGGMRIAWPPFEEQSTIAHHLDGVLHGIERLSLAAQEGIELLKERRGALIAAAVTGQIDVRGAVEVQAA